MLSTNEIVLLLLSSVLVSSETQERNELDEERSSKGENQVSDQIEAVMISDLKGGAPQNPQFTKPLDTKWTFWYESKAKKDRRSMTKTDYLKEVKRGKTFETISSFWDCWNEVQEVCPASGDCNYELFKHGIKPVWEDPRNIKGGKCVLTLPRTSQEETMKHWVSLMITLLIGEFGPEINGVVLSTRPWGNVFAVWVRNCKDKESVDAAMKHLHELFGPKAEIRFQRHQASMRKFNNDNNKPATRSQQQQQQQPSMLEKKQPLESEVSSFEGEKNKGKEQPRRRSVVTEETKGMLHSLLQQASEAPLQPPIERVNYDANTTSTTTIAGVPEGSSVERIPSYLGLQKRRSSLINTNNKQNTKREELPSLSDLTPKQIGIGLAIAAAGIATSVLSWTYL
jgi:translation initiation factor 4E